MPRTLLRSRVLIVATMAASILALPPVLTGGDGGAGAHPLRWKGAETFSPVTIGPNPARCGASPPNLFAVFAGSGVDTNGGVFEVQASGCLNTETLLLFNLEATDTYVRTGDSIRIVPHDVALTLDEETCVATNARPVPFSVDGGTGRFSGATGGGTFDLALNHPPCNGLVHPVHVWFTGELRPARRP